MKTTAVGKNNSRKALRPLVIDGVVETGIFLTELQSQVNQADA
ncbi:MAG TPA: hypothetical protein VK536_00840 [Candidatus Limnocylindrales bacterium]|nr:hypothetical protein [Candidatus Limnocylindrales bacterium]